MTPPNKPDNLGGLAESENANGAHTTMSLTLARELRAAISGVILGSIELKFAYFLDHDDYLRQNYAEEKLTTLLEHLDDKLTELTDLVATDRKPK